MSEIQLITPPIEVGHPVIHMGDPNTPLTVFGLHDGWAWVAEDGQRPETCALVSLKSTLPPVQAREAEPGEIDKLVERAKLDAVKRLVHTIATNDPAALGEMLARLGIAYKGRIIVDPKDDATPEQMAQGLLTAVLMAAVTVEA